MTLETDDLSAIKRKLIVHDALIFAGLSLVTVALFVVTLFLFRSFAAHRSELATRWSGRGEAALQAGHPGQATVALRTALSYAPGQRSYELLLAQALGDAGHTEESYNYFMGLWATQPGDGFINLRLARLAAKKGDRQGAAKFYRASIYGTWEGDGALRRRDVRLELARYLLSQHDNNGARTELLIAGGNNPGDSTLAMTLAQMLESAGDSSNALVYYQKVIAAEPKNESALEAAGRLALATGDYDEAHRLLERASREQESSKEAKNEDVAAMLQKADRILELMPSKKLSTRERVARILVDRGIAKKRFEACSAQAEKAGTSPPQLQILSSAWTSEMASTGAAALSQDFDTQDATVKLIFDTEVQTNQVCGAPSGDDALLLLLAQSPNSLD
jgi:Tfp pilus assembly protein PilF